MNKEYTIIESLEKNTLYSYRLYCNDEFVKSYIDREAAENVKANLVEVDKLKEGAPNFKMLETLEEFIKSI